jgi:hypothetical protein
MEKRQILTYYLSERFINSANQGTIQHGAYRNSSEKHSYPPVGNVVIGRAAVRFRDASVRGKTV